MRRCRFRSWIRFAELGALSSTRRTAYNNGVTEEIVRALDQGRVAFGTRWSWRPRFLGLRATGPTSAGFRAFRIHQAVEASLRRLQTDVIDLYQIHRWDFDSRG